VFMIFLAACSGSAQLSESERAQATGRVRALSATADVVLDEEQATSVVAELGADTRRGIEAETPGLGPLLGMSEAVVGCIEEDAVAVAVLKPNAGGLREASLQCAAGELDEGFVVRTFAAIMAGEEVPAAEADLRMTTAFALCVTPNELAELE